ncbi:hypothetical protein ACIQW9_04425 [Herminiimonas sp. NPDC097707]|uniref:hypothetical protein n=1 Tax=Herminiimonas sp. NPDC097707 TaxID=3364007 RepID=UPI00383AF347
MPDRQHKEDYKGWRISVWITPIQYETKSPSQIPSYIPGVVVKKITEAMLIDQPIVLIQQFSEPQQCLEFGIKAAREYIDATQSVGK